MPASHIPFVDMESTVLEAKRAIELAFELLNVNGNNDATNTLSVENEGLNIGYIEENRKKISQNMTECVPVPSSEHVAEIVGRQGCKIKALRAKTNTYIKTPVRGEEPVFVVTGRREDVGAAKREILSAAEHFSQIRASRKANLNGSLAPGPPSIPGQITLQLRVPYRVVGLVVGPKGATIKRIQQQTHTYIVTPSRDKEPVFEVTGIPENVHQARKEIETHIAIRTGAISADNMDCQDVGTSTDLLAALHKENVDLSALDLHFFGTRTAADPAGLFRPPIDLASYNGRYGDEPPPTSIWSDINGKSGNSFMFSYANPRRSSSLGSSSDTASRLSPPTDVGPSHLRRLHSDPLPPLGMSADPRRKRDCVVCYDSAVVAALVPCGHNLFCMECATRLVESHGECPSCRQSAHSAIRIIS